MAELLPRANYREQRPCTFYAEPDGINSTWSEVPQKVAITSRSNSTDPSLTPIYANLFDDEDEKIIPRVRRPRELAEDCSPTALPGFDRSGLGEDGQSRPRRAADEDRTDASEDLSPNQRRHADLRHRKIRHDSQQM